MINTILRFIYKCFATKFEDFMVEAYVKNIPLEVTETAFSVMSMQKKKLLKFNEYQAYELHRKMATDPKNSQRYLGMFVQLKVTNAMLIGRPEKAEVTIIDKKEPDKSKSFTEHLEAATNFATNLKEKRRS